MEDVQMGVDDTEIFFFKVEFNQFLRLIIKTVGSNKEIFLRELINNSSDALRKIQHESSTDKQELFIHLVPDKACKTLSIIDTGIGMTKADLVNNFGTIARSGTKEFTEALPGRNEFSMIGQLGVGFYSAYVVAEKVKVTTKHNDDEQYIWESQAGSSFIVTRDVSGEQLGRGTKITLYLKEDELEYLEERRLEGLVKKNSEFISWPIYLWTEKTLETMIIDYLEEEEEEGEFQEGGEEQVATSKRDKEASHEWVLINSQKPIWQRTADISDEEYASFYKDLTNDPEDYLCGKHFSDLDSKSILFVPRNRDDPCGTTETNHIKIYAQGDLIMDNRELVIPDCLAFVKGVVDFSDLPLTISTEAEHEELLTVIRKNLVNKCIGMFTDMAEKKEYYDKFYETFSDKLRMSINQDSENRAAFADLLRYHSTKSGEMMTSLKDYVTRMKEGQNNIYYTIGKMENCPLLEKLEKKGYEVLFVKDVHDLRAICNLKEYGGKKLVSTFEGKKRKQEMKVALESLCEVVKAILCEW